MLHWERWAKVSEHGYKIITPEKKIARLKTRNILCSDKRYVKVNNNDDDDDDNNNNNTFFFHLQRASTFSYFGQNSERLINTHVLPSGPPRWPSGYGVRLESERSGVRIPLATGFFRVESYQ